MGAVPLSLATRDLQRLVFLKNLLLVDWCVDLPIGVFSKMMSLLMSPHGCWGPCDAAVEMRCHMGLGMPYWGTDMRQY